MGFAYDAAGRLASVTDARGTVLERYGYDAMDRLLTRTDALGKEERYAYNAGGQLTQRTDRQGRVITYGYDGSGRLIRIGARARVTHRTTRYPDLSVFPASEPAHVILA